MYEFPFSDSAAFWVGRAKLLERSPRYRTRFMRLQVIAHAERRFTQRLADVDLEGLDELCAAAGARDRPGQWRDLPIDPEYGNAHAVSYKRGLVKLAGQIYGATAVGAQLLHEALCSRATAVPVPTDAASWPIPAGAVASGAAAPWLDERDPGLERAWQRWRRDHFYVDLKGP